MTDVTAPRVREGHEVLDERLSHVLDVDLARPLPALTRVADDGTVAARATVVVRLHGEPLGLVDVDLPAAGPLAPQALGTTLAAGVAARLAQALAGADGERESADAGTDAVSLLAAAQACRSTAYSRAHAAALPRTAECSVVVCTREHPDELRTCLESLVVQDHPAFSVYVVDNAPLGPATRAVVAEFADRLDIHYVLEPRPGLSRARNTALRAGLRGGIVAWLDDDEVADPAWLSELCRAFAGRDDVVAVSGVVVPAELVTQPQVWFEQFGGHSKGRGFTAAEFSPRTWARQHPLFPLPPFGVGANMAFRLDALHRAGGFDEALGAGTPTQGSEDTKMFCDLMLDGGTMRYWPSALTRHHHRRDLEGLRRQMRGYATGLTGFYFATVLQRPRTIFTLLRLAPHALHEVFSSSGQRAGSIPDGFPTDLLVLNRRSMLAGPWLYLRGRWAGRTRRAADGPRAAVGNGR